MPIHDDIDGPIVVYDRDGNKMMELTDLTAVEIKKEDEAEKKEFIPGLIGCEMSFACSMSHKNTKKFMKTLRQIENRRRRERRYLKRLKERIRRLNLKGQKRFAVSRKYVQILIFLMKN